MNNNRIVLFDNLRYFLAVGIVIFHSSLAYSGHAWWPVSEQGTAGAAQWVMVFLGPFTMSFFFFIAGYFALPAIQRKGTAGFLKGKFKRLGIPWVIIVLTICPVLPFVFHYTRNGLTVPMGYLDFWLKLHRNAVNFDFGVISSMKKLMETDGFYLRYMWFLSLLLVFFVVFAVVYRFKKGRFAEGAAVSVLDGKKTGTTFKFLFGLGFFTFLGSALLLFGVKAAVPGVTDMQPLFTAGNIVQFGVTDIFSYIVYFILGIRAYRRKWLERGLFPGNFKVWAVSLVIITVLYFYLYEQLLWFSVIYKNVPTQPVEIIVGVFLFLLTKFLTVCAIGFFTSLVGHIFGNTFFISKRVTATAYELYLGHYIIVIVMQLLLFMVPGVPLTIKFITVTVVSVALAQWSALYIIKPRPRLAAAVAVVILIVMMVSIR